MNSRLMLITYASSGIAFISLAMNTVMLAMSKRQRRNLNEVESRLEEEITALSHDLDTTSKKSGEHGRRIAWLEARGIPRRVETKTVAETIAVAAKPTMTEKKHRVLSLARRGQDVQAIAQTLGMNYGEVELMLNLVRAA